MICGQYTRPVPVLVAALGALVVSLDSTVNIAFPAIAAAFEVGPTGVRWVIICYVLTYALTSFTAGVLADRWGPARVFGAGLWLSAATFTAFLLVPSFGGLLVARVAQGVGGGLVYGAAPALVTLSVPRERHGAALGLMSLGMGAGLAVGPLIGGALVEAFGWRSVFVFRAPVAAAAALLALLGLARGRSAGAWRLPALDEVVRWPVVSGLILVFLANWAQFAVWLLVPFYLVGVLGLSPVGAGLVFTVTALGTAVAAPVGGWLSDRVGRRWPMAVGLALETAGLVAITRFTASTPPMTVAVGLAAVGLGLGLFQAPNLAQVMSAFPNARQGAAGGLAFMVRTLGIVGGVEVHAAIFGARQAEQGFDAGFSAAFVWAAAVCGLAVLIACWPSRAAAGRIR